MAFYPEEGDHLQRISSDGDEKYLGRLLILGEAGNNHSVWIVNPGPGFKIEHLLVQPDGFLLDYSEDRIEYRLPTDNIWRKATDSRKEG